MTDAPTLYRPANGTEGAEFHAQFCDRCACDTWDGADGQQCAILVANMIVAEDETDEGYRPEWRLDPQGQPTCTAFIEDVGQGWMDPDGPKADQARYDALPRDPVSGRPVIA